MALAKFERLIDPLRTRARELGYALTVHGSLVRDIDLVAVPWAAHAVDQKELAEALRVKAAEINRFAWIAPHEDDEHHRNGCPGMKPHGRLVWSFHLGGGPYLDLSVMPRGSALDEVTLDLVQTRAYLHQAQKRIFELGGGHTAIGPTGGVIGADDGQPAAIGRTTNTAAIERQLDELTARMARAATAGRACLTCGETRNLLGHKCALGDVFGDHADGRTPEASYPEQGPLKPSELPKRVHAVATKVRKG